MKTILTIIVDEPGQPLQERSFMSGYGTTDEVVKELQAHAKATFDSLPELPPGDITISDFGIVYKETGEVDHSTKFGTKRTNYEGLKEVHKHYAAADLALGQKHHEHRKACHAHTTKG